MRLDRLRASIRLFGLMFVATNVMHFLGVFYRIAPMVFFQESSLHRTVSAR